MLTRAATATADAATWHIGPTTTALMITILGVVTLCYLLGCWIYPFRTCKKCAGMGVHPGRFTKHLRPCRRCDAKGMHLRTGRRIINYVRVLHEGARGTTAPGYPHGPVPGRRAPAAPAPTRPGTRPIPSPRTPHDGARR